MSPKWQAYLEFVQGRDPRLGGLPICPYAKGGKYFIAEDTNLVVLTGAGTYAELRSICEAVNPKLRPFGWFVLPGAPDSDFNINGLYTHRTPEPVLFLSRAEPTWKAAKALERTRYFDQWTEEHLTKGFPGL